MAEMANNRPRVFMDVQIGTEPAGRIVMELFIDKTPKTCENFRALCTLSHTSSNPKLTYKMVPFHRIIDEFMIQGGDTTKGNGTGGESIYGSEFKDENIGWRAIDKEGLVCMANRGKDTNGSQFFITLAPCEHLNAKHTILGQVVSGVDILKKIAKVDVDGEDRPADPVIISHCGELERRKRTHVSEDPDPRKSTREAGDREDSRGRKRRRRSRSADSSLASRSTSRHHTGHKHRAYRSRSPKEKRRHRDDSLDSTLRGRSRRPSPTPPPEDEKDRRPANGGHRRERLRSLSPSRSKSPHERRRRSRSPRGKRHDYRPYDDRYSYRPDNRYVRRERGDSYRGMGERWGGEGGRAERRSDGYGQEGRLTDKSHWKGADESGDSAVRFKGRGSMKFRERKW